MVLWGEENGLSWSLKEVVDQLSEREIIVLDRKLAGLRSPYRCSGCGKSLNWKEFIDGVCSGTWQRPELFTAEHPCR